VLTLKVPFGQPKPQFFSSMCLHPSFFVTKTQLNPFGTMLTSSGLSYFGPFFGK
jgi:hypothetical protein